MPRTAFPYLFVLSLVFGACSNRQKASTPSIAKQDSVPVMHKKDTAINTSQKKPKYVEPTNMVFIDTILNNYAVKLTYLKSSPLKDDKYAFKALLNVGHNKKNLRDTVTLSSINPEDGLRRMLVLNNKIITMARAYAYGSVISFSLPCYTSQELYSFEVIDDKLNELKAFDKRDYILSENGFMINSRMPIYIMALYATRYSKKYNASLFAVSNESSIFHIKDIMLPAEYDDSQLLQSKNVMNAIYKWLF
jgi:hypothetical protein